MNELYQNWWNWQPIVTSWPAGDYIVLLNVTSKAELDNVKIGIKLLGYLGESNYSCITSLVALYLTEGISHGDEVLFSHFTVLLFI